MKKATIVRSILFAIVIANMILKYTGRNVIDVDEGTVESIVEMLISVSVLVLSWWKNNSLTKNAQMADRYLEKLKSLETDIDEDEDDD